MPEKEMEQIILDLNYLGESSQRELAAYRNVGSVEHLKRLNRKESRRRRRIKHLKQIMKAVVGCAEFLLVAWVLLSWMDVVLTNRYPNPVYQAWNFFTIIF